MHHMKEPIHRFALKLLIVLLFLTVVMVLYHGARFFLLVLAGALIANLWRGAAHWVSDKSRLSFRLVLPVIIILNLGLIFLFAHLASPNVTEQANRLSQEAPKVVEKVIEQLRQTDLGSQLITNVEEDGLENLEIKGVFNFFSGTFNVVIDFLLILVFALFLSADPKTYRRGLMELVPPSQKDRAKGLFNSLDRILFRWFIGKIIDMFSIFIMTVIGLWILGMPMVFTLALIAFFFSFVPNVGPVISAIPALAIALLDSPQMALSVGLLYLGIQLVESYFVTPNVQKHASFVPPVLLLLVQFLLARFLGVLGLFLSTPLLVIIMVVIRKLYIERYTKPEEQKLHVES